MMKLTVCTLICAVFAAPSYAASLGRGAEAVPRRHARSLPYSGGSVDGMGHTRPDGPVDAFMDTNMVQQDDSSEDVDSLVAKREQIKKSPYLDLAQVEEKVAEINSQIESLAQTPPPPEAPPAPVNPTEAGAEAAAQQEAQQSQQDPGVSAAEQAAEAAEQAPPAPDASSSSSSGPDNSNKEDGDGNGNNNNAADNPAPMDAPSPAENNNNNGGGETGGQQDSGAGGADPPAPPTTQEPIPYEPPQNGNSVDFGDEDTKS